MQYWTWLKQLAHGDLGWSQVARMPTSTALATFFPATLELITHHGGHFVATGLRETSIKGIPVWIITVTLRYTTGFEGYVGDLLHDGEKFTFLTEQSVINERVRQIAADPESVRQWNEYRASTLRPRKT